MNIKEKNKYQVIGAYNKTQLISLDDNIRLASAGCDINIHEDNNFTNSDMTVLTESIFNKDFSFNSYNFLEVFNNKKWREIIEVYPKSAIFHPKVKRKINELMPQIENIIENVYWDNFFKHMDFNDQ